MTTAPTRNEESPAVLSLNPPTDDQQAAHKALAYLAHIDQIIETLAHRMQDGPYRGEFMLTYEQREMIGYLTDDIRTELMKMKPFQLAADLNKKLMQEVTP